MKVDFLIIGQGLAGSLIGWQLLKRGQTVLVVDRDEPCTSSKIAAGIMSPVTGNRVTPSWRVDEFLPFAQKFYWSVEEKLGIKIFHHTRIARLFNDGKQSESWKQKRSDPSVTDFLGKEEFDIDQSVFHADHGGFEMKCAGWLDVPAFLSATQHHLLERLGYAIAKVDSSEIKVSAEKVCWKNVEARHGVVFCQGWEGNRNPFFDWMPMNAAKGEILEVECDQAVDETRIVNRGGWVLPLGNGKFRAGSNYDHDFSDPAPSETGKSEVLEKISGILKPEVNVTGHRAGIRPIIRRSKPLIGRHPKHEKVIFFNGLGSKGVMNGPFVAAQLADHLVHGSQIEEELDIRANF